MFECIQCTVFAYHYISYFQVCTVYRLRISLHILLPGACTVQFLHTFTCLTSRCVQYTISAYRAGPDFNNLISTPLSLRPKSAPADTLRVALFNARSVDDPLKRAEILTLISNSQVDILFLTSGFVNKVMKQSA